MKATAQTLPVIDLPEVEPTQVVNIGDADDLKGTGAFTVYVGLRKVDPETKTRPGNLYANPFSRAIYDNGVRKFVPDLVSYHKWVAGKLPTPKSWTGRPPTADEVRQLSGMTLLCFCPTGGCTCHARLLAAWADALAAQHGYYPRPEWECHLCGATQGIERVKADVSGALDYYFECTDTESCKIRQDEDRLGSNSNSLTDVYDFPETDRAMPWSGPNDVNEETQRRKSA